MTQSPVTVTYSLEEVLARIERKIDDRFDEVNHKFDEVNQKFDEVNQKLDNLQKEVTDVKIGQVKLEGEIKTLERDLKGDIKALDEKLTGKINGLDVEVKGLSKRLENQEFLSRGVLIGLIVAILGGFAKLFGIVGNP